MFIRGGTRKSKPNKSNRGYTTQYSQVVSGGARAGEQPRKFSSQHPPTHKKTEHSISPSYHKKKRERHPRPMQRDQNRRQDRSSPAQKPTCHRSLLNWLVHCLILNFRITLTTVSLNSEVLYDPKLPELRIGSALLIGAVYLLRLNPYHINH